MRLADTSFGALGLLGEDEMSWLQDVLDSAAADNLCVRLNCTTCGSHEFELRLMRAAEQAGVGATTALGWIPGAVVSVATALADLPYVDPRDEPAIRFIIQRLYSALGETAFAREVAPILYPSEVGRVLRNMERHYEATQKRRSIHDALNNPVAVARRREEKRLAEQKREEERQNRKKRIDELRRFALEQAEATASDDEQYSFLFRTPGATDFAYCPYWVTEDWEFDGAIEGLSLPWDQKRIDTLQNSDAELTPEELRQWRRAKCRTVAAGSDRSSTAWVVPLRPAGDVEGYALFLCEGEDPEVPPFLEGVYLSAEVAVEALHRHGVVSED